MRLLSNQCRSNEIVVIVCFSIALRVLLHYKTSTSDRSEVATIIEFLLAKLEPPAESIPTPSACLVINPTTPLLKDVKPTELNSRLFSSVGFTSFNKTRTQALGLSTPPSPSPTPIGLWKGQNNGRAKSHTKASPKCFP